MSNFNKVIEKLLGLEGGYVNHPADKGGPTNWGITQATLTTWRKKAVTALDVKNLSRTEAMQIYKTYYWDIISLDKITSDILSALLFDQSVNRGPSKAASNMQKAYNNLGLPEKLTADGVIGPKTIEAINNSSEFLLAFEYLKIMQLDYVNIVLANTTQLVFLRGWTNRVHANLDEVVKVLPLNGVAQPVSNQDGILTQIIEFIAGLFSSSPKDIVYPQEEPIEIIPINDLKERIAALARAEIGVKEIVGSKHNNRIIYYHSYTGKWSNDEIAWCGSFVEYVVVTAGLKGLGAEGAGARNWLKWGQPTDNPKQGDLVILWRVSKASWQGHVGIYMGEDATSIQILGGNQDNEVNITKYPKSQLLGYRTY